jgi:hypothetical protein
MNFFYFYFRRQIKEKEEVDKLSKRETLEEGRKMKQKLQSEKRKLEFIKEDKLSQLKVININSKYTADLERLKIK